MNPMQLLQMVKTASNPMAMVQQLAQNNPQLQQLMTNIQGKTPIELEQYARNLAQSKGVDINKLLNQYGLSVR